MFCNKCGAKLFDGDRFCSDCGAVVQVYVRETVRDQGDETIRVNAIAKGDATVRESIRVPEKAPERQSSASSTRSSVPAAQPTDFDYGDFATYNKQSESDSSSVDYSAGFSSMKTVSYRENEINRSLFLTIAAGYGIFYILYQVAFVFTPRFAVVSMPMAFYQIASIVLGISYIVYLAGAFLCVNKTPLTHMIVYMIPMLFPVAMFFINILIFRMQFMTEYLVAVAVQSLGTIVIIALFALLTNERIINVTHPVYPIGVLFILLTVLAIGIAVAEYFYQQKNALMITHQAVDISLLSFILRNSVSNLFVLLGFTAVQFFEKRREV